MAKKDLSNGQIISSFKLHLFFGLSRDVLCFVGELVAMNLERAAQKWQLRNGMMVV